MRLRSVDAAGDVLPVLHTGEMFSGALAVASLVVAVLSTQAWMTLLLTIWVLKVKWV